MSGQLNELKLEAFVKEATTGIGAFDQGRLLQIKSRKFTLCSQEIKFSLQINDVKSQPSWLNPEEVAIKYFRGKKMFVSNVRPNRLWDNTDQNGRILGILKTNDGGWIRTGPISNKILSST